MLSILTIITGSGTVAVDVVSIDRVVQIQPGVIPTKISIVDPVAIVEGSTKASIVTVSVTRGSAVDDVAAGLEAAAAVIVVVIAVPDVETVVQVGAGSGQVAEGVATIVVIG